MESAEYHTSAHTGSKNEKTFDDESCAGCTVIQMTRFIEDVHKLGSLAILLHIPDWESVVSPNVNEPHLARVKLMEKFVKSSTGTKKELLVHLRNILMQPTLKARRSAEKIDLYLFGESTVAGITTPSPSELIPQQYRKSHIENIGKQCDDCTRPSVLNCLSEYPADWASIGSYLVGQGMIDRIKQECPLPGDEAAYLVQQWWRNASSLEFSWEKLRNAILNVAEKKYSPLIHHSESLMYGVHLKEQAGADICILFDQFEELKVDVLDELSNHNFQQIKRRLRLCDEYEPHYADYLRKILVKPSMKNIDNFFDQVQHCWNFLDVGLLKTLVKKFIKSDQIKSRMEDYNALLLKFQQTPVAFVIQALRERNLHPRKPEDHGYKSIIEKLELDPYTCTLERLNLLRTRHYDKLRELNLLETALMVLNNAELCCVIVTWLIMADEVEHFEKMFKICIKEGEFLEDNCIIEILLNGHSLQTMERDLLEASRKDDVKKVDQLLQSWNKFKHNINKTNKEGKTSLIVASEFGHSEVVALLLDDISVDVDYQVQGSLWTALFFAHHGGHQKTVKLLEEYGASKAIIDRDGRHVQEISTVSFKPHARRGKKFKDRLTSGFRDIFASFTKKKIFKYCEAGHYEDVKKIILSRQVDINLKDGTIRNWTPLIHACRNGHFEIVKFLLEHGADIHVRSTLNDWTALSVAASWDHLRIANLLLRSGADPNAIIDPDDLHFTPLMYIADLGYVEMARALLKHGAIVDIANKDDSTTALFAAIREKDERMVKLLLEYGADCNRQADKGWTPLMESARRSNSKICKMLIDSGAKTELVMQGAGKVSGEAAIHVACYFGHADNARVLIENGADVNKENEMGLTPLMIATKQGHMNAMKTLLECKSLDIDQLHKENGLSAVFWAATTGNIEICEILLQHKALSKLGKISIVDCAPLLKKKAVKELFSKYKPINLPGQRELVVASTTMSQDVFEEVPPAELHIGLHIGSQQDNQEVTEEEDKCQGRIEEVAKEEDCVSDSRRAEATQQQEDSSIHAIEQQTQTKEIEDTDSQATSTDENQVGPQFETESSLGQIVDINEARETSAVSAEEVEETKEQRTGEGSDDDASLYGDEPHTAETPGTKPSDKELLLKKFSNMTLEQRVKLVETIWASYTPVHNIGQQSSWYGSSKGVQQVAVPQLQIMAASK